MSNYRPRDFHLGALIAMALSGLGLHTDLRAAERHAARQVVQRRRGAWGKGKKRYHVLARGKRKPLPPGSRRPACKFIPNLRGYRYEHGHYVPR